MISKEINKLFNKKNIFILALLCLFCFNTFLGVSNPLNVTKVDNINGSKYAPYNPHTDSNRVFVCFIGNDKWDGRNPIWNGTSGPKKTIKSALESIKSNGNVYIAEGIYHENGLTISKDVTIKGINTMIDGDDKDRILKISNGNINIQGITFIQGNKKTKSYEGGAIYNSGVLNISDCKFIENHANKNGDAIYNQRVININNSQFMNNTSSNDGGAIYQTDISSSLNNVNFENNQATDDGGSIYIYQGILNTHLCTFYNNKALYGGAIFIYFNSISNLKECIFKGNNASYGGAIENGFGPWTPTLNIWHTQFIDNMADYGSVINNNGYLNANDNYWGSNPLKDNMVVNDYLLIGSCHISYWEMGK